MGVCGEISITICYILHFSPKKLMTKFFKMQKNHHFWPRQSIFGQIRIFLKNLFLTIFPILSTCNAQNFGKKQSSGFFRKMFPDGMAKGQAYRLKSIRRFWLVPGVKKKIYQQLDLFLETNVSHLNWFYEVKLNFYKLVLVTIILQSPFD